MIWRSREQRETTARVGDPLPLVGPRDAFNAPPAPQTPDATGRVRQRHDVLAEREIPPAADRPAHRRHAHRLAPTLATVQPTLLTAVEIDHELLGGLVLLDP